ncbi:MAG: hypothetical protein WCF04_02630 [Candidatus Nanopelagicales bacterium]
MRRTAALLIAVLLAVGCGPQPEEGAAGRSTADSQSSAPAEATRTPTGRATSPQPSEATSSQDDQADGSLPGDGTGTPSPATTTPPDREEGGNGGAPRRVVLRGLPPGPASPDTPAPYRWYASLQSGTCSGLDDTASNTSLPEAERAMFAALAEVCRLLGGESDEVDWRAAQAALDGSAGVTGCLLIAARDLLASAVGAHEADPGAVLVRGRPRQGTACPVAVNEAAMTELTSIAVAGDYLIEPTEVRVAGERVESQFEGASPEDDQVLTGRVSVILPEGFCAPAGEVLEVQVAGPGYEVSADVAVPDVGQGSCPASSEASESGSSESGSSESGSSESGSSESGSSESAATESE